MAGDNHDLPPKPDPDELAAWYASDDDLIGVSPAGGLQDGTQYVETEAPEVVAGVPGPFRSVVGDIVVMVPFERADEPTRTRPEVDNEGRLLDYGHGV